MNKPVRHRLDVNATMNSFLWDDLRFPAQGINPIGAASDPTVSNVTGMLEFSGSQDNLIAGAAQMPHSWRVGSGVKPHIHVRNPTSNSLTSRWKFEYDVANRNGNFGSDYGNYTELSTISHVNPANTSKHSVVLFGEIDMEGFTESSMIMWRLTRLASSDVLDNDTAAVVLLELDFHFQQEKDGTPTVYTQ